MIFLKSSDEAAITLLSRDYPQGVVNDKSKSLTGFEQGLLVLNRWCLGSTELYDSCMLRFRTILQVLNGKHKYGLSNVRGTVVCDKYVVMGCQSC